MRSLKSNTLIAIIVIAGLLGAGGLALFLVSGPVQAQTELALSDFNREGLGTDVLALFTAGDQGDEPALYAAAGSRWPASGSLEEGDAGLGQDDAAIVRVVYKAYYQGGPVLRLNDADAGLALRGYFGSGGDGADLTIWVQTASQTVSFPASGVQSAGGNYVNFDLPSAASDLIGGISSGDRFILAMTRPLPQVTVTAGAATVSEADGTVTFTLSRTGSTDSALTVLLTSARLGDYVSGAIPASVTIPAASSSTGVTLALVDDDVDEKDGFLILRVAAAPSGEYAVGSPSSATVTVTDDDELRVGRQTSNTAPGAPTGLTAMASGADTINLSWTAPTSDGGATITGYKVEVKAGTLFAALATVTTTSYSHTGLEPESRVTYRVKATNSVGDSAPSSEATATTDEIADAPIITISGPASVDEPYRAEENLANFTLTRTGATTASLSVTVEVSVDEDLNGVTPMGGYGTITPRSRVRAGDTGTLSVVFSVGNATTNLAVTVVSGDVVKSPDSTLTVEVLDRGGYEPGTPKEATATLKETDVHFPRVFEAFDYHRLDGGVPVYEVNESIADNANLEDRKVPITFGIRSDEDRPAQWQLSFSFATTRQTAEAGDDYVGASEEIYLPPSRWMRVPGESVWWGRVATGVEIKPDNLVEGPEHFNVDISRTPGTFLVVGRIFTHPQVKVIILDDDLPETPAPTATAGPLRVDLSWTAAANLKPGPINDSLRYDVETSADAVTWTGLASDHEGVEYFHFGPAAGSQPYYRVRATVDLDGDPSTPRLKGEWSAAVRSLKVQELAAGGSVWEAELTVGNWHYPWWDPQTPQNEWERGWRESFCVDPSDLNADEDEDDDLCYGSINSRRFSHKGNDYVLEGIYHYVKSDDLKIVFTGNVNLAALDNLDFVYDDGTNTRRIRVDRSYYRDHPYVLDKIVFADPGADWTVVDTITVKLVLRE